MTQAVTLDPLSSWQESSSKRSILDFVRRVTSVAGASYVPIEDRVAVFDNDGTLWCEKPMPVQADFLMRRVGEMAASDPSLRDRQPWKAVSEQDYRWLGNAITHHYMGDDADLKQMSAGLMQAYAQSSIEEIRARCRAVHSYGPSPDLGPAVSAVHLRADGRPAALSQ